MNAIIDKKNEAPVKSRSARFAYGENFTGPSFSKFIIIH